MNIHAATLIPSTQWPREGQKTRLKRKKEYIEICGITLSLSSRNTSLCDFKKSHHECSSLWKESDSGVGLPNIHWTFYITTYVFPWGTCEWKSHKGRDSISLWPKPDLLSFSSDSFILGPPPWWIVNSTVIFQVC